MPQQWPAAEIYSKDPHRLKRSARRPSANAPAAADRECADRTADPGERAKPSHEHVGQASGVRCPASSLRSPSGSVLSARRGHAARQGSITSTSPPFRRSVRSHTVGHRKERSLLGLGSIAPDRRRVKRGLGLAKRAWSTMHMNGTRVASSVIYARASGRRQRVSEHLVGRHRGICSYSGTLVHMTLKHADIITEAPFASNSRDPVTVKNISELLLLGKEGRP